jgi:predicted nucleic acid-binding protein
MSAPIIDSVILIDVLKNHSPAKAYIESIAPSGLFTQATVVAEILMGIRDKGELHAFDELLVPFQILHPNQADSISSLTLLREHKLAHVTGYLDCLIAATALRLKMPISTLNEKHFRPIPGIQIIRPY